MKYACIIHSGAVSKSDKVRVPRQNKETSSLGRAELSISSACLQCTHGCSDDSQAGSGVTRMICNLWLLSKFMFVYFWWILKVTIPSESVKVNLKQCVCVCVCGNGRVMQIMYVIMCYANGVFEKALIEPWSLCHIDCHISNCWPCWWAGQDKIAPPVFVFGPTMSLSPHRVSLLRFSPSHCYHDAHHSLKKPLLYSSGSAFRNRNIHIVCSMRCQLLVRHWWCIGASVALRCGILDVRCHAHTQ